ncbi:helix-turn-helix domain-containing protein [Arthrobacter sp. NPDC056691]|uniref:helix-turn-helix domain-containing protein n=1 Tax=Arthrobacter sp. NPDC056691 TaxID=3345913 RepID=UPI00366B134F
MTIARQLERLFAQTAGPQGRPVTLQEIIHRMEKRGISTMSLSYLQQLRSGQAENPRLQHLRALADAFNVPLSYFLDEGNEPTSPIEHKLTKEERTIALRVHGLSDGALSSIRAIVELARKSEQLDDPPQSSRGK